MNIVSANISGVGFALARPVCGLLGHKLWPETRAHFFRVQKWHLKCCWIHIKRAIDIFVFWHERDLLTMCKWHRWPSLTTLPTLSLKWRSSRSANSIQSSMSQLPSVGSVASTGLCSLQWACIAPFVSCWQNLTTSPMLSLTRWRSLCDRYSDQNY